jgi:hypothetical protein
VRSTSQAAKAAKAAREAQEAPLDEMVAGALERAVELEEAGRTFCAQGPQFDAWDRQAH